MLRTYLSGDPSDRQKRDPLRVRMSVLFCFVVNVLNGFAACAVVYDVRDNLHFALARNLELTED